MTTTHRTSQETAMNSVTLTYDVSEAVDVVNANFRDGIPMKINGRKVASRFGMSPATQWQNGSIDVDVVGRTPGKIGSVHAKAGTTVDIEFTR